MERGRRPRVPVPGAARAVLVVAAIGFDDAYLSTVVGSHCSVPSSVSSSERDAFGLALEPPGDDTMEDISTGVVGGRIAMVELAM